MNIGIFFRVGMLTIALCAVSAISAQEGKDRPKKRDPMPVYVTPYYDSKGPKVEVGEFSKKLASADAKSVLELAAEMKKEKEKVRTEAMFVLAIRLYDLGHKDDAVYWFYTAQFRARLFAMILDKEKIGGIGAPAFELRAAFGAFQQLSGEYINGYAFGELPKLEKTLAAVLNENKKVADYSKIYPDVKFVSTTSWAEKNTEVSTGLEKLVDLIKTKADFIKEQRKKNGIEGKY